MQEQIEQLKTYKAKLDFICQNYDPFTQEITSQTQEVIQELNLAELLEDPFQFTNQILQLLDEAENKIKDLIQ